MSVLQRECLPVDQVLDTVMKVESDMARFYETGAETTNHPEVAALFTRLTSDMKTGTDGFGKVCASLKCGETHLDQATPGDLDFLSALAQSAFYRLAGKPEEKADQAMSAAALLESGLELERDLLLFHTKFFKVSCEEQRPIFSDLVARGERHITELTKLRQRIKTL